MYRFGIRLYFDKDGEIIFQTGYIKTNVENYFVENDPMEWNNDLKDREDIQMVQYGWDEYREEFSTQKLLSVDPETLRPVFGPWPEPDPSTEPDLPPPMSEMDKLRQDVAETKQAVEDLVTTMTELIMGGE